MSHKTVSLKRFFRELEEQRSLSFHKLKIYPDLISVSLPVARPMLDCARRQTAGTVRSEGRGARGLAGKAENRERFHFDSQNEKAG